MTTKSPFSMLPGALAAREPEVYGFALELLKAGLDPIEVGEKQEPTTWGAVTYIIHQAR
jgi:hypothetical protein